MPNKHQTYMQMAVRAARKGGRSVRPNPLVGCVLVKNDRVVSIGYHSFYGGPHAEVDALQKAGSNAKGATAYLTLEPCSHWGKTPPCAPQLLKAGIKSIFIAMKDPNPKVNGKGIQFLKRYGCTIDIGIEGKVAHDLNRPFKTWILKKRPHVILKMAQSLDGKIATKSGDSHWISSTQSRKTVHKLRSQSEAILVGAQTAIQDNPTLTSHGEGPNPTRLVLDPHLRTPLSLQLYQNNDARTILVTNQRKLNSKLNHLKERNVEILFLKEKKGRLDLRLLMKHLFNQGVYQVLIEGGGNTAWHFLQQKLLDEVYFYVAPKIIGGKEAVTSIEGVGIEKMNLATGVSDLTVTKSGPDFLFHGYING